MVTGSRQLNTKRVRMPAIGVHGPVLRFRNMDIMVIFLLMQFIVVCIFLDC